MSSKKINIAKAILNSKDEKFLNELEAFLKSKNIEFSTAKPTQKSDKEFINELETSLNDLKNGKIKSAKTLLQEIQSW